MCHPLSLLQIKNRGKKNRFGHGDLAWVFSTVTDISTVVCSSFLQFHLLFSIITNNNNIVDFPKHFILLLPYTLGTYVYIVCVLHTCHINSNFLDIRLDLIQTKEVHRTERKSTLLSPNLKCKTFARRLIGKVWKYRKPPPSLGLFRQCMQVTMVQFKVLCLRG